MSRPTRASEAGRAYLDLQNRARAERGGTQQLLTLYVVERWLARLSVSQHAEKFVLTKTGRVFPTRSLSQAANSRATSTSEAICSPTMLIAGLSGSGVASKRRP